MNKAIPDFQKILCVVALTGFMVTAFSDSAMAQGRRGNFRSNHGNQSYQPPVNSGVQYAQPPAQTPAYTPAIAPQPALATAVQQPSIATPAQIPQTDSKAQGLSQPVVPGTGVAVTEVNDDFEDSAWDYTYNLPKIFNNGESTLNKNLPAGISKNQLWYEGPKRGQPDVIKRVDTPEGGLAGSTGALLLRSLNPGSSHPSYQQQQDDFVCNMISKVGKIPASLSPSVVTRVYFPPVEQWERRTGCHFAFRTSLETETPMYQSAGYSSVTKIDESWPGIFVNMELKNPNEAPSEQNPARLFMWMKANERGHQLQGPEIKQTGWWTLGMSFTPDGYVHYYARPGVEDLTAEDRITSSLPYGQKTARLRNYFFNVCNGDNGKTWSTEFIVDDPKLFIVK